ncbi:salicylate hydroxylase [Acidovorax sp. 100]|uniref:FAD-dependent monooxygenase n=1 Tax=Acidovorax sp. 100 TaxID=2135635 RepID=UPI000EF9C104|nr:FAD-dependent monooxygenase [Acidovorax sp. 100]RMA59932.1 salicylate hydroxylase [Acidovorax sp. 100]
MTSTTKPKILVAGGGIGGLTAALSLLKRGFPVQVYEQAKQLGEVGAGLQLSANTNRVLFALGLRTQLEAVVSRPSGKQLRLWDSGESWDYFDLGTVSEHKFGAPYFTVYRPDLMNILASAVEAASPGTINLGKRIKNVSHDADVAQLEFEDGTSASGDLVVGADGVHSVIRSQIFGDGEPVYSGNMAWRGVMRMDQLPAKLQQATSVLWVGPGAHIVTYPIRRNELLNFVGVVEKAEWTSESWSQQGSHEELHEDFSKWHSHVHALIDQIETPFKWSLRGRKPLQRWSTGRITLLGDACHPTLPFLAQGAAMSIEDGYVLARALDEKSDIGAALQAYDGARIERANKIVSKAEENGKRFHNDEMLDPTKARAFVNREWSEENVSQRYDWLYSYDAERIAL